MAHLFKRYSIGLQSHESEVGVLVHVEDVQKIIEDLLDDEDIEIIRGKAVYYLEQLRRSK